MSAQTILLRGVARRREKAASHGTIGRRRGPATYVWMLLVAVWALIQLAPVVLIFYSSFRSTNAIFARPFGWGDFDLGNYASAWNGALGGVGFATYFLNTLVISAIALVLGVGAGTFAAYAISRSATRIWAKVFYAFFLLALAMPYEILVIPIFQTLGQAQLLNSSLGAGIVYGALVIPTTAVIMRAFFDTFPTELLEAARVDGASELRAFLQIVLPLSRSGLISVLVLSIVYIWGEVQLAVIMLSLPQAKTVAAGMLSFQGQFFSDQGAIFAGLSIATVPLVLLYILFQRYVTRGLTMGAVK